MGAYEEDKKHIETRFEHIIQHQEQASKQVDEIAKKLEKFILEDFHKLHLETIKSINLMQYKILVITSVGLFVMNKFVF